SRPRRRRYVVRHVQPGRAGTDPRQGRGRGYQVRGPTNLGRVLNNAQIAAPLFAEPATSVVQKMHSQLIDEETLEERCYWRLRHSVGRGNNHEKRRCTLPLARNESAFETEAF